MMWKTINFERRCLSELIFFYISILESSLIIFFVDVVVMSLFFLTQCLKTDDGQVVQTICN